MPLNVAAYALPVFVAAIVIEALISRKRGTFYGGTVVSDIGTGGVFQGLELLFHLALVPAYVWIYTHLRWVTWQPGAWQPWLIGLIGVDLLFYWWHRASHVVNVLWAVHGVHHQREDYNLAVALRQPALEPLTWFIFYAPLALLGVDLPVYLGCYGINRFYQFWIHTQLVDKLGPLEWVLNTPSHHRVHHGVQPRYLDRNYGAILIVWDRLFGTFQTEEETPIYGTTEPLRSYNPIWANVKILADLAAQSKQTRSWRERVWLWFAPPGWRPAHSRSVHGQAAPSPKRTDGSYQKYRPKPGPRRGPYVLLHCSIIAAVTTPYVLYEPLHPPATLALGAATFLLTHMNLCALMENKRWAIFTEVLRFALMATTLKLALTPWAGDDWAWRGVQSLLIIAAISWIWLLPAAKRL